MLFRKEKEWERSGWKGGGEMKRERKGKRKRQNQKEGREGRPTHLWKG